jgi:hypothetical protein
MSNTGRDGAVSGIIKGLTREPAYLLVFGLAFLLSAGAWVANLTPTLTALTTLGAFSLAALALFLVERRRRSALPVESPAQRARLAELPREESAIRGVLEGIAEESADVSFVYSSTLVDRFIDYKGKPIDYPFTEEERQVTSIPDAYGISKVHSLLHLAGKRTRLRITTSRTFRPEYWEENLILVGSDNSNVQTGRILRDFNSPFRFNDDVSAIIEVPNGERWPSDRAELEDVDYGVVIKLKIEENERPRIYLILAGIGGLATLACCHFLETRIGELHSRFGAMPFGCVVSVERGVGFTSVHEVRCKKLAPLSE